MSMDEPKFKQEQQAEDVAKSFCDHDPEKYQESNEVESSQNLKLDSKGLPLVPQPSRFKDDPLVSTPQPQSIPL
jgi:hypothetical protein